MSLVKVALLLTGCAHGVDTSAPPYDVDAATDEGDATEVAPPPCTWNTCERPDADGDAGGASGCNGIGCNTPGTGGAPGPGAGQGRM